jgi:hypothetical protein
MSPFVRPVHDFSGRRKAPTPLRYRLFAFFNRAGGFKRIAAHEFLKQTAFDACSPATG